MDSVRVRMYRQGLGDCFLLTFDPGGAAKHMLIDCGVLKGTPTPEATMTKVAQSIHDETGGRLDVLVATHEHWDHVSGFLQAKQIFDTFEVGEVWLAWTEDPADELAGELRQHKARTLHALAAAGNRLAAMESEGAQLAASRVEALLDFHGGLGADGGGATTADALTWVKQRDAPIHFLRPGELRAALGANVFVLGPPHDRKLIKRSDPSKRASEVYELTGRTGSHLGFLAAVEALGQPDDADRQPFEQRYALDADELKTNAIFADRYFGADNAWRQIEQDWLGSAGQLALQLDSDTNNTSLVLAFELADDGPVLLFPGDAQVGNWLSWESLAWKRNGDKVTSDELLARTVLYKVGHHGSHNATLKEKGLELMTSSELAAMIPVNRVTAQKKRWNMPFPPLYNRLEQATRGRIMDAELGIADEPPEQLTTAQWQRFRKQTTVQDPSDEGPGWVEYVIDG